MRLRELRRAKGITLKEMGNEFGLSESAMSHYETGKRNINCETLLKFAEYFDCSVDYILGRSPFGTAINTLKSEKEEVAKMSREYEANETKKLLEQQLALLSEQSAGVRNVDELAVLSRAMVEISDALNRLTTREGREEGESEKFVLFFEANDIERTAKVSLVRNQQQLRLNETEIKHLSTALNHQIREWSKS